MLPVPLRDQAPLHLCLHRHAPLQHPLSLPDIQPVPVAARLSADWLHLYLWSADLLSLIHI